MDTFDDLFDRGIPQDVAQEYLAELHKLAVSTDWVGRMARSGVQNSTHARAKEVASGTMKKVLDAVKKKGPNAQAHIDKRMALHQAASSPQRLSVGSVSSMAPPMRKAAEQHKLSLSTEFIHNVARSAAQKASPQRVRDVAGGSMKKVLEAAKKKGPNVQAHVDKRMALRNGVLAGQSSHPPAFTKRALGLGPKLAAAVKSLARAATEPPPEAVIMQEQQGQLQQALAENEQLHGALQESQGLIQEHAQAVEQAGEMAQQTQAQLQEAEMAGQEAQAQAQEQLAMAQQQAQMAQAEAQTQAAEAASQADGKMRLAIRIQQIRQQLADMASQDIVAEEGEQAEPLLTPGQQGMGDPNAPQDPAMAGQDPAAAQGAPPAGPPGAEAAPPAAAEGGAAPAAEKPKPKAAPKKEKSEDKGESKAGPKTEIKIGSATVHQFGDVGRAKGVLGRAKQLITGSRARRLDEMFTTAHAKHKDAPRNSAQGARVYRLADQAMRERAKSVGTQGATAGTVYVGGKAVHDKIQEKKASGIPRIPKGAGMARAKELLTGSRLRTLDKARDIGEYGTEARKVLAAQVGVPVAAAGATGAGIHHAVKKNQEHKQKTATEDQVRADARRAAGRTGALQGGAALGVLSRLRGHSGAGTAARTAIGGLIGRMHGTAGFDKRELANDLHMERALTKSKRDRVDKALEKGAASADLNKAKGVRRFGELLSGSRMKKLRAAGEREIERAGHHGAALMDEAAAENDSVANVRKGVVRGTVGAVTGGALYKKFKPHKGNAQKPSHAHFAELRGQGELSDSQIDRLYGLEAAQ